MNLPAIRSRVALNQFAPLSIVRMIWKHKLLSLAVWVVLTALAAAYIRRMPNVYEATAVILVDSQKIPEKFVASTVEVSLQDSLTAINRRVLNSTRLQGIISEFHLYPNDRARKTQEELIDLLRKELVVAIDRGFGGGPRPGAFRVTFQGANPQVVAGVVNRVTELFIHENLQTREQRAEGTSEFIEEQLAKAKDRLTEQETGVARFKQEFAGELPEQEAALSGNLNRLQTQLEGCQDAINRAQQNKTLLESTLRFSESSLAAASRPAATTAVPDSPVSSDLAVRVQPHSSDTLRAQLDALRLRYLDDYPEVRRVKSELKRELEEEARQAREAAAQPKGADPLERPAPRIPVAPEVAAEINRERERVHSTKTQLDLVRKEIEAREAERQTILQNIREYQSRIERLPTREQQLAALTRDYSASKANYQSLLDKKMSAAMSSAMEHSEQSERFTVADPARVPLRPAKPKRMMLYGGAAAGLFLLSLTLGIALEFKRNVLLGEWELPPSLPVLGRVSAIKTPSLSGPRVLSAPGAMIALLCAVAVSSSVSSNILNSVDAGRGDQTGDAASRSHETTSFSESRMQ